MAGIPAADPNAPCEFLTWDSAHFGLRIARATTNHLTAGQAAEILDWCGRHAIDCLYFLSDPDPESTAAAESHGFHLTDVRVTFEIPLDSGRGDPRRPSIRTAAQGDVAALRTIAGVSHTDSRFYQDGNFSRACCGELYRIWIENSCTAGSGMVLVAEHEGLPAGYVTCDVCGDRGRIGLLAVSDSAQGVGLGRALVAGALRWMRARELASAFVVTQGRNLKAQRLYEANGFRAESMQLWYHLWPRTNIR